MNRHEDPLWNPAIGGDAEIERLQALLAPYRVDVRLAAGWTPSHASRRPLRTMPRLVRVLAAAAAACVLLWCLHLYRLDWNDGRPWQFARSGNVSGSMSGTLAPGDWLRTNDGESVQIDVARIGAITLSPDSRLRLIETRAGRHRVDLQSGHLRARIWAPPNHFGVSDGTREVVDLGCDFDLWKAPDGSGRVYVRSGWIEYRVAANDVLVPAGYAMQFDAERPSTPLRPEADADFVQAVGALERALLDRDVSPAATLAAADTAARTAHDADAFTLLALLSEYPRLAAGDLYPRLARALKTSPDDAAHRAAWVAGRRDAIDAWWTRLPTQPKNWWAHWTDALG